MNSINDRDQEPDGVWRRYGPLLGGAAVIVVIGGLLYSFFGGMGATQPPEPPAVQQISVVQPPPPPPPPPDMEEPPPPEMEEIHEPEPEPEPIADEAPADEPLPGDDLGLDADGVAGSDGFGLKAKKGGRALLGGGDRNAWYAGVIQNDLQALLAEIEELRKGRYAVVVRLRITAEGRIEDADLIRSTGDRELDASIKRALNGGLSLSSAPPEDLPQPIRVRISSRG